MMFGLGGCEAPQKSNSQNDLKALPSLDLPVEFSQSYEDAFQNQPESTARQFLQNYDRLARRNDVTKDHLLKMLQSNLAAKRATYISYIYQLDLDGDGKVTREEYLSKYDDLYWLKRRGNETLDLLDFDENKDGAISGNEVILISRELTKQVHKDDAYPLMAYLALFDFDKNGTIIREEVLQGLEKFHPDFVKTEAGPVKLKSSKRPRPTLPINERSCDLPSVKDREVIISVSGNNTKFISNIALNGQEQVAYVAHLTIEKGDDPLYVIATSRKPVLWLVDGDVKRVKHFVTQAGLNDYGPGVGVTGLKKSVVSFLDKGCLPHYSKSESKDAFLLKRKVNLKLKKDPSILINTSKAQKYSLPSGDIVIKNGANKKDIKSWWSHEKYQHDGQSVTVPIKDVIAPDPVEEYEVLPGNAGLAKLLADGALKKIDSRTYHIVKPIPRFPASMGSRTLSYILGNDIDMPLGATNRHKVYSEETGELIR